MRKSSPTPARPETVGRVTAIAVPPVLSCRRRAACPAPEQLDQRRRRRQIAAVRAEMHAGQRDLLEAGRRRRGRPPRAARRFRTLRGCPRVVGMMQYEHGSAQPVCTRSVNAVRPATPGSIGAPQLPSPSPNRSAVESRGTSDGGATPRISSSRRGLSSFGTTRSTFGSARPRPAAASRSSRSRRSVRADCSRAIRRIVCRAPWSATRVTEQVLTTTRSASSGDGDTAPRGAKLLLEAERVGLVHAAAEGDDGILQLVKTWRIAMQLVT